MKSKIFNAKLLLLCGLFAVAQGSFAQKNKAEDEKEFDKKMEKLQEQMRDLQKEISKMQVQKLKEKSVELQKLSKELSSQALVYTNELNVSGLSKGLGVIVSPNIGISPKTFRTPDLSRASTSTFNYNFNFDDKTLKEKVQSGELKEKSKAYSKSYSVDANDKLEINNTYGKVTVNTWTKNEIKVDVQMKAYANEEEDAQKMLDKITISDSKENSVVSFKTTIERNTTGNHTFVIGTWFNGGKSHTSKLEVNYVVYMPAKSQLDLTNKFGGVMLPDLSGRVNLKLSYGTLVSQQLTHPENDIKVSFGDAKIASMYSGDVNVSYGKLILGTADKLRAKISFGSMNVDKLKSSGDISARYGDGVTVTTVDKNCKNINVDAQFTKVNLGVKDSYDFDVTTRFGSFDYNDSAVKVISRTPADNDRHFTSTRTFKGQVNKGNSDRVITIKSSYASVKFD
ncbi:hypothetical protein [Mucilaginibacter sp. PAMB04168]|uniref:hypothetical protein n=1 Tax=Mucilaginibacter sp. PAMB04168 TaxID=3138567 RepID=UPI0031F6A7CA